MCPDLGVSTYSRLGPAETRRWTRDDFADATISRRGVSLHVVDGGWIVTNHSTSMRDTYLFDVRYGRRAVPPTGSLRPRRLSSWLLLPSSHGPDGPYVIAMRVGAPPSAPAPRGAVPEEVWDEQTSNAGEPTGALLREGLLRCRDILAEPAARDLLATYARSWFSVTTEPPAIATHRQIASCRPGDASRGERLLSHLRRALWGTSAGQSPELLIELLIRHGVLTYDDVRAARHDPACGHAPAGLDPSAAVRRSGSLRA
jgi:hypothetical protein